MFDFWTFFIAVSRNTFLFFFDISNLEAMLVLVDWIAIFDERSKKGIDQNWGMGQLAKMRYKTTFLRAAFYVYDASSSNFSGRANVYARIWLTATFHASLVGWISFLLQKNEWDGSWRYMRYVHDASVRIPLADKENLELQDSSSNRPRNGITFLSYLFDLLTFFLR